MGDEELNEFRDMLQQAIVRIVQENSCAGADYHLAGVQKSLDSLQGLDVQKVEGIYICVATQQEEGVHLQFTGSGQAMLISALLTLARLELEEKDGGWVH